MTQGIDSMFRVNLPTANWQSAIEIRCLRSTALRPFSQSAGIDLNGSRVCENAKEAGIRSHPRLDCYSCVQPMGWFGRTASDFARTHTRKTLFRVFTYPGLGRAVFLYREQSTVWIRSDQPQAVGHSNDLYL